jgi:hypothetical protein
MTATLQDRDLSQQRQILEFFTPPATMTRGGRHTPALVELPRDLAGLARVVQGAMLHLHRAPAYGVTLTDERHSCHAEELARGISAQGCVRS